MFASQAEIKLIGTRHGEKLYEALLTREEYAKATDLERYYRIAADDRDLNYNKYFSEGDETIAGSHDYNSHNTRQLSDLELETMLNNLDYIQSELTNGTNE